MPNQWPTFYYTAKDGTRNTPANTNIPTRGIEERERIYEYDIFVAKAMMENTKLAQRFDIFVFHINVHLWFTQ